MLDKIIEFYSDEEIIIADGFDEAFIRLWNFYLMYCSAGFSERSIDVVQFTLSHANSSSSPDSLRI